MALDLVILGGDSIQNISMLSTVLSSEKVAFQSPPMMEGLSGNMVRKRWISMKKFISSVLGPYILTIFSVWSPIEMFNPRILSLPSLNT